MKYTNLPELYLPLRCFKCDCLKKVTATIVAFIMLNRDDAVIFFSYIQLLLVVETDLSFEDVLTHIRGSSLESTPSRSTGSNNVLHKTTEELLTLCKGKLRKEASTIASRYQW